MTSKSQPGQVTARVKIAANALSRRRALVGGAATAGAAMLLARGGALSAQEATPPREPQPDAPQPAPPQTPPQAPLPPGEPGRDYTPVVVPNGWTLPFTIVDGVKVFHLVAEEVYHEF